MCTPPSPLAAPQRETLSSRKELSQTFAELTEAQRRIERLLDELADNKGAGAADAGKCWARWVLSCFLRTSGAR